jgi:simple sugar transport system permease protein
LKDHKDILLQFLGPVCALVLSFVVGGLFIWGIGKSPLDVYSVFFSETLGNPYGIGQVLFKATPLMFTGISAALALRAGLFNIGAEGQLAIGAFATALLGFAFPSLPAFLLVPLCLLGGMLGGALWGFIPGFLKARFGAHEVINTIMMNYISFRLMNYLLNGPMMSGGTPASPEVLPTAYLATLFPSPVRLHWGFFIALGMAVVVYWLLWKTTFGMEIRMVGANARAARYAGIAVPRTMVLAMVISAVLCGLAGSIHLLGVDHRMMPSFSPGYGFDAIALALLGNSHPVGVVLASLLFAFLRNGATHMQAVAGTQLEIIRIIQGLVIVFIAAPEIIRSIFHLRSAHREKKSTAPSVSES